MVYVALLRGVNVGGKALISMSQLKETFERLGLERVKTYINSGNVIFSGPETKRDALTVRIEQAIEQEYKLPVKVLLKTHDELQRIYRQIPVEWATNKELRCYVLFLWPAVDRPEVLEDIPAREGVDEVQYVPGAVVHKYVRKDAGKSKLNQLAGTDLYKQITIRVANTVGKILKIMEETA